MGVSNWLWWVSRLTPKKSADFQASSLGLHWTGFPIKSVTPTVSPAYSISQEYGPAYSLWKRREVASRKKEMGSDMSVSVLCWIDLRAKWLVWSTSHYLFLLAFLGSLKWWQESVQRHVADTIKGKLAEGCKWIEYWMGTPKKWSVFVQPPLDYLTFKNNSFTNASSYFLLSSTSIKTPALETGKRTKTEVSWKHFWCRKKSLFLLHIYLSQLDQR